MSFTSRGVLFLLCALLIQGTPLTALADQAGGIVQRAETSHYRLELDIGHPEQMFTTAEAAKMHPTAGEIMVSGTMVGAMPGMSSGTGTMGAMTMDWRHLELHVINMVTGTAVEYASVHITVTNAATGKRVTVPISQMYGIREGFADWHYGNNVLMPRGTYDIVCEMNGERASFRVTIPGM